MTDVRPETETRPEGAGPSVAETPSAPPSGPRQSRALHVAALLAVAIVGFLSVYVVAYDWGLCDRTGCRLFAELGMYFLALIVLGASVALVVVAFVARRHRWVRQGAAVAIVGVWLGAWAGYSGASVRNELHIQIEGEGMVRVRAADDVHAPFTGDGWCRSSDGGCVIRYPVGSGYVIGDVTPHPGWDLGSVRGPVGDDNYSNLRVRPSEWYGRLHGSVTTVVISFYETRDERPAAVVSPSAVAPSGTARRQTAAELAASLGEAYGYELVPMQMPAGWWTTPWDIDVPYSMTLSDANTSAGAAIFLSSNDRAAFELHLERVLDQVDPSLSRPVLAWLRGEYQRAERAIEQSDWNYGSEAMVGGWSASFRADRDGSLSIHVEPPG